MYASLKSVGSYVPEKIVSNVDLEKMVNTSDEWIKKRTGISERRVASTEESCSDLGYKAALVALKRANMSASDIDLVICATLSPDYLAMPSTACLISEKLGIRDTPAFDVSAACSGYIYVLSVAKAFVESNIYKNILIVGSEKISRILDYSDRGTCILFGDGAGASVITATKDKEKSILDVHISADGSHKDFLYTPLQNGEKSYLNMKGNETFKLAVRTLTKDAVSILKNNNLMDKDIDLFVPHQANYRIIKAVQDALKIEDEKVVLNLANYGNTSAASIPIALSESYEQNRFKSGDLLLLDAFGGGVTWGSALVKFGGE